MAEIAERLRQAIDRHDTLSIRAFQREMDEREVDGTSYGTVHSYLRGETEPSLAFLGAAAQLLGVREEWLILGQGEPTEVEERQAATLPARDQQPQQHIRERLQERHPLLFRKLSLGQREVFLDVLHSWWFQAPDRSTSQENREAADQERLDLAEDLLCLITVPFRCWGFEHLDDLPAGKRFAYFQQMLGALMAATKPTGAGDPLQDRPGDTLDRLREVLDQGPDLSKARQIPAVGFDEGERELEQSQKHEDN